MTSRLHDVKIYSLLLQCFRTWRQQQLRHHRRRTPPSCTGPSSSPLLSCWGDSYRYSALTPEVWGNERVPCLHLSRNQSSTITSARCLNHGNLPYIFTGTKIHLVGTFYALTPGGGWGEMPRASLEMTIFHSTSKKIYYSICCLLQQVIAVILIGNNVLLSVLKNC